MKFTYNQTRVVRKFAWLPIRIGTEVVWLERYELLETCKCGRHAERECPQSAKYDKYYAPSSRPDDCWASWVPGPASLIDKSGKLPTARVLPP